MDYIEWIFTRSVNVKEIHLKMHIKANTSCYENVVKRGDEKMDTVSFEGFYWTYR